MRDLLPEMNQMNILAVTVLLGFLSVFVISVVWALKADKPYVDRMSRLPLDANQNIHNEEYHNG